jgi:hypothetical protein
MFYLHGRGGGVDFVEEDRAGVGGHEAPGLVADGAGEGAFDVAEQLGLEEGLGECAAAHFDERFVPSRRAVVDRPGEEGLAGAALAGHQDRGAAVGDGLDEVEDLEHLVVVADDVLEAEPEVELLLQGLVLEDEGLLADGLLDRDADFVVDDRLREVVERAELDRLDGALDRAVARDHDGHDVGEAALEGAEEFGGLDAGHVDVGEQDFDLGAFHDRHRLVGLVGRADLVALTGEELGEGLEHDPVLVHDQQPGLVGRVQLEHPITSFPREIARRSRGLRVAWPPQGRSLSASAKSSVVEKPHLPNH